eukprot:TRINITY_DN12865_c0_g1_i1.p2 TRINITY_DN12865_c0_g1~~TRINITY_DN12865_c0_g1_i1.p2  ORF type:complete len:140 (+),score=15.46 TRINITY_DN12865_c0_g1_i1:568-987(+)
MTSGLKESCKGEIIIPDDVLSKSALQGLISYFYSDSVLHITDVEDALFILGSAGYLCLTEAFGKTHTKFLDHCENVVLQQISVENCLKLLQDSFQTPGLEKITTALVTFITTPTNFDHIPKEDFNQLPNEIKAILQPKK